MLEKNDVMLVSSIIHKIYNIAEFDEMRKGALEAIRFLIPFDTGGFFLASSETPYQLTDPIALNVDKRELEKYLNRYQSLDYTRWTFAAPSGKAYRETDLLDESTRINTPYYREMFTPIAMHYSMLLTIIHKEQFLGVINLFRKKEDGDFSDKEVFLFELLGSHLNSRLFRERFLSVDKREIEKSLQTTELMEAYHLTLREVEIIQMLCEGVNKDKICELLCISLNTLKKHIANIYKKMEISSMMELLQKVK